MLYPLSYGGDSPRSPATIRRRGPTAAGGVSTVARRGGSRLASIVLRVADVTAGETRVLVVDDDDVIRQLISVNLELEGFDVYTAVDGLDALERAREVHPAVVTLDIMMPRLDGWDAAARLRSDPETAHVKVVLLSARAQEADIKRGSRLGVDHYLTKPFDPDELIAVVRRLAGLPDEDVG